MKVLLISTNFKTSFKSHFPQPPAALSAFLKTKGYDTRVVHLEKPKQLNGLEAQIAACGPDIVGVTATGCQAHYLAPIVAMAKRASPAPVLIGGVHATLNPEATLDLPGVDGVVIGEGEFALLDYLQKRAAGEALGVIANFAYRRDGQTVRGPKRPYVRDLDDLPHWDRECVDFQRILNNCHGHLTTMYSRGCLWECAFCSNVLLAENNIGPAVRNHSVAWAMEDLEYLAKHYRFRYIGFRDDTFTWHKGWTLEFLEQYARRIRYPFDIFTRSDRLDEEIMDSLEAAGCKHVFLGLDSGNDHIRNEILNKQMTTERLIEVCDYLNTIGIKAVISNQVGLPFETPEQFQDTIEINRRIHRSQVVFSAVNGAAPKIWVFTPFPGTRLEKVCRDNGWLKQTPTDYLVYRQSIVEMPAFPRREIDRLYRRFRYLVYKDSAPLAALFMLLYDTRAVQTVMGWLPASFFSMWRHWFSVVAGLVRPKGSHRTYQFDMAELPLEKTGTAD